MDELVSKWGIGSGISLFIAAGVSEAIFTGTVNWIPLENAAEYQLPSGTPGGTIPKTIPLLSRMTLSDIANGGGLEQIFLGPPNPIIALIGTIAIFLIVAYVESTRIELPLAHGRVRGARGRYPIRLIYASNIPVILMSALLANVNMFSLLLWSHPTLQKIPLIGHQWWIGAYTTEAGENVTKPLYGGAWYLSQINGVHEWLLPMLNWDRYGAYVTGHNYIQVSLHVIVYLTVMIVGSILFAKFWIETTNMGPEAVAKQIESSGMQIPGFRRDPRVLRKVLERYIPMVTVISGAFVGALAAIADMIGTVGNSSGTGVLLTVGIIIRLYEEIGKEQMMEMHPVLRGFFGGE
jgi:preprotein translocase subunit SecY